MKDVEILRVILSNVDDHEYQYTYESTSRHVMNAYSIVECMREAFQESKFYDLWLLRKRLDKEIRASIGEMLCEEFLCNTQDS